jgi:pimeloyl-ACP methyl ester carboxylesterase
MSKSIWLERDGVRLHALDYGGSGPPALLLHGLAGHAGEWADTAAWMTRQCRVVALDARGHGESERTPADVSRAAHVADAAHVIEHAGGAPAIVVGQSLGAHAALLVAARRPDLVRALVVAEASPEAAPEERVDELHAALAELPPRARRFEDEVMVRTLREAVIGRSYWDDWDAIECPTLIVRAERGLIPPAETRAMLARQPLARLAEVAGAGHDLHLERPDEWRSAVSAFLAGATSARGTTF